MSAIIFYTPFLKIGGIEKVTIEYLKLLIEQGNKVELFVDYDMGEQNFLLSQVPKDVNVTFIKGKVLSRFIYSLRTISKSKPYLSPFFSCLSCQESSFSNKFVDYLVVFFVAYTTIWLIGNDNLGTATRLRMFSYISILIAFFIVYQNKMACTFKYK